MKYYVTVLIAAVTVNSLVMAINGKTATATLAVPYIDTLLPPFEDVQDNSKQAAGAKINATGEVTPATATTTRKTTMTTTTTTKKPITNEVNNILPELSIEALLPPLFEAKTEHNETTATTKTTTTRKPISTTRRTTTIKPSTTTTLKPSKIQVPDLFLDSLLPPLLNTDTLEAKTQKVAVTTAKPTDTFKTTKKSYYQQQTQHSKDVHLIHQDNVHNKNLQKQQQLQKDLQASIAKEAKNYKKPVAASTASTTDEHVAESKTLPKQVSLASSHQHNVKFQDKIEALKKQHDVKQVAPRKYTNNYSFDLYFGSTTPRPPKSGLPTITPFPHRLGR